MATKQYDVTIERGQRKSEIIPLNRATLQVVSMRSLEGTAGGQEGGEDVTEENRPAFEIVSAGPASSQFVLGERFEGTLVIRVSGEVEDVSEIPHAEEQQSGKRAKDAEDAGMRAGVREVEEEGEEEQTKSRRSRSRTSEEQAAQAE